MSSSQHFPRKAQLAAAATPQGHERVDDTDTRIRLAVVEVFGKDGVAAGFQGGSEDGGIPVGKPVALLDPKGRPKDGFLMGVTNLP